MAFTQQQDAQFCQKRFHKFNTRVKVFHSNNGRESVNQTLVDLFKENEVLHQTTCTYMPQRNDLIEHKNRHILEVARALCFTMRVPKRFQVKVVMIVVFLINQMSARAFDYQIFFVNVIFHSVQSLSKPQSDLPFPW